MINTIGANTRNSIGNKPSSIKQIFDDALVDLTLDKELFKRIKKYGQEFVYKNDEHINFFGSNLTGVYAVRFKTTDRNDWNLGILDIDEPAVRKQIIMLPTVKETWVRGTDVMNISCLYLVHRIYNMANLGPNEKYDAAMDVLMALHYKLISSLMANYYPYPADIRLAQMTYANLSKKFSIRQHGSWYKVLENQCKNILSPTGIHKRTIERFNDDGAIQNMITDVQGRLRAMVKKLWAVFEEVRSQNNKLMNVSGKVDLGDKVVVRDLLRTDTPYVRYLGEIVLDKKRFIKKELIAVVGEVMQTMPEHLLEDVLVRLCDNAINRDKETLELLDETLLHAFDYMSKDKYMKNKLSNLGTILIKFRALYMASRSKEAKMLRMRDLAEKIAASSAKTKSSTVIASLKTGLLLYIILRTFSMDHYN